MHSPNPIENEKSASVDECFPSSGRITPYPWMWLPAVVLKSLSGKLIGYFKPGQKGKIHSSSMSGCLGVRIRRTQLAPDWHAAARTSTLVNFTTTRRIE